MASKTDVLQGDELRRFAEAGRGRVSVIVEAARPPVAPPTRSQPRTAVRARDTLPPAFSRAGTAMRQAGTSATPSAPRMGELADVLKSLGLDERARPNMLAGTFTIEVTPSELLLLAALDGVQAIRLNRRQQFVDP